jgi:hypothetical protein
MDILQSLYKHVMPESFLAKLAGGDQDAFQQMEAPALRQLGEQQSKLATRFSNRGMGGRHGSGFRNAMNSMTSNFLQDLHSKRNDFQSEKLQQLMKFSEMLMQQRPYQNFLEEETEEPAWWQKAIGIGAPVVGTAAGAYFGGPTGAAMGAKIGSQFGQAFMPQSMNRKIQGSRMMEF